VRLKGVSIARVALKAADPLLIAVKRQALTS
jgi:hypothetical protein